MVTAKFMTRWWFQAFFIFTPIWGRFPFWLIFFKGVGSTTNQKFMIFFPGKKVPMIFPRLTWDYRSFLTKRPGWAHPYPTWTNPDIPGLGIAFCAKPKVSGGERRGGSEIGIPKFFCWEYIHPCFGRGFLLYILPVGYVFFRNLHEWSWSICLLLLNRTNSWERNLHGFS